jgi:hypothetical protein
MIVESKYKPPRFEAYQMEESGANENAPQWVKDCLGVGTVKYLDNRRFEVVTASIRFKGLKGDYLLRDAETGVVQMARAEGFWARFDQIDVARFAPPDV